MLTRYRIVRGRRAPEDPLPDGVRQDTRKHTRHCLRPTASLVEAALGANSDDAWETFRREYRALLDARFADDPTPFEQLAELSRHHEVFIGCNCPTKLQPDVERCHTVIALAFIAERFPDLDVQRE